MDRHNRPGRRAAGAPIADDEFDRLYQVVIAADGSVTTVLLTTPAAP